MFPNGSPKITTGKPTTEQEAKEMLYNILLSVHLFGTIGDSWTVCCSSVCLHSHTDWEFRCKFVKEYEIPEPDQQTTFTTRTLNWTNTNYTEIIVITPYHASPAHALPPKWLAMKVKIVELSWHVLLECDVVLLLGRSHRHTVVQMIWILFRDSRMRKRWEGARERIDKSDGVRWGYSRMSLV